MGIKRLLCLGIAAAVVCTSVPATVLAQDVQVKNERGEENNEDFLIENGVLKRYLGEGGDVIIPEGVTSIGDRAFSDCSGLTSVEIPEGVTSIGEWAFYNCSKLINVKIPSSVKDIGSFAFMFCYDLTSVEIPEGVASIGQQTFYFCYGLTSVKIPSSVTSIGDIAFSCCYDLTSVEIPSSVTSIGNAAFSGCNSLTNITIPSSVASIGDRALGYYRDENWKEQKMSNFVIYGEGGSAAEKYAKDNGFAFNAPGSLEDISSASVTLDKTSYIYDGKAKTPSVTVKLNGKTLALNTDYTVAYSDNVNAGTAKATVTGKGNYTGSKTVNFTIAKAGQDSSIICKKTLYKVTYGTKPFKINATSKSKLTFTSSKPKIVSVHKDTGKVTVKNTGVAGITIKAGKDSVKVTVKVSPKKQAVKSVKVSKGKKLTVKWAKDKMATGYQVQISTAKNFKKNVKSKNVPKASCTFTKLKTGRKYYVRLRSYKKSGKEMLYGAWSKAKTSSKVKK